MAPEFALDNLSGDVISLADYKGAPVILNFWASWCPPCRAEMSTFNQIFSEYHDQGITILAVNATDQDSVSRASQFVTENNLNYEILLDHSGFVSNQYNVYSLPTTFFIDKNGIIQRTLIGGPLPAPLLRIEIEMLMEK